MNRRLAGGVAAVVVIVVVVVVVAPGRRGAAGAGGRVRRERQLAVRRPELHRCRDRRPARGAARHGRYARPQRRAVGGERTQRTKRRRAPFHLGVRRQGRDDARRARPALAADHRLLGAVGASRRRASTTRPRARSRTTPRTPARWRRGTAPAGRSGARIRISTALPVQLYEIWNEPDNPEFWAPHPDAAAYAQLYAAARAAILAADPSARVLVGGLTLPARFLPAMLSRDAGVGGAHRRRRDPPVRRRPGRGDRERRAARVACSTSLGMRSVPLFVTEFGWTTSPAGALDYAPAQLRPGYIEDTLAALGASGCGIDAVTLYTWTTPRGTLATASCGSGSARRAPAGAPTSVPSRTASRPCGRPQPAAPAEPFMRSSASAARRNA